MVSRANLLLAFGLIALDAVSAGPCKPIATSSALTSGTTVTVDSTTLVPSTESSAATITESPTESTTFASVATTASSDATFTSELTTFASVTTSEESTALASVTITAGSDATLTSELTTSADSTTEAATTTTTALLPDSTPFNIFPDDESDASGPLKIRTLPGGSVYFNNPNPDYSTGVFIVTGRGQLINGAQTMCAFFRTGQQYADIIGCQPDDLDGQLSPIKCEIGSNDQLNCSVQGRFCYYQNDMLHCDSRGLYPFFYIESAGSYGYSLILGPNGLSKTPVQVTAEPFPTEY